MTQAEAIILELISIGIDRTLTILQWWVGITIGLAAVGHFAGRKLNTVLTLMLLALYASYTLYLATVLIMNANFSGGYVDALIQLRDSGTPVSPAGTAIIESLDPTVLSWVGWIALVVSIFGAFIGTITYVGCKAFEGRRRT